MMTVDDPALLRTMFFLWERLKLVVEPTGALGAAAVAATAAVPLAGARVGVILSGGNVDLSAGATVDRRIDEARSQPSSRCSP